MIDIAVKNGIRRSVYRDRLKRGWPKEQAATKPVRKRKMPEDNEEIAIYRNDEMIAVGTRAECAKKLGLSIEYIRWLLTPSASKVVASRKNPDKATMAIRLGGMEE